MPNEKKTDIFISKLLESAKIEYTPNGSDIKEVQEALTSLGYKAKEITRVIKGLDNSKPTNELLKDDKTIEYNN